MGIPLRGSMSAVTITVDCANANPCTDIKNNDNTADVCTENNTNQKCECANNFADVTGTTTANT